MDQIPEGYISIREAFALLFRRKHPEEELTHDDELFTVARLATLKSNEALDELAQAFWKKDVPVKLRHPKPPYDICDLATSPWKDGVDAFYVITRGTLPEKTNDTAWANVASVTPFISRTDFDNWSNKAASRYRADDPFRQSSWTYGQAIAWIVFRTSDGVRRFGSSYALQALLEATDCDDGLQKAMTVADADFQLLRALCEDKLSASAIDAQGQPCKVPQVDWPYLEHITSNELGDRFRLKQEPFQIRYTDVRIPRVEVVSKWPGARSSEGEDTERDESNDRSPLVIAAVVKQDIHKLLDQLIQSWEDSGRIPSKRIGIRGFVTMVTDRKSTHCIPDAKPSWANIIWRKYRPPEWERRGPYTA